MRKGKSGRTRKPNPTEPAVAPDMLANVGVLIHELSNLVDGSLRCLGLARRSLCGSDLWAQDPQAERVQRQLDAASAALEQMAGLVHAALQGPSLSIGSPMVSGTRPVTLGEAIEHAVEVAKPRASELGIDVRFSSTDLASTAPAGPLYLVILNGVKNAIESIERTAAQGATPGGLVHVEARTENFDVRGIRARKMLAIDITDDGAGPPKGSDFARVFDHGFTVKQTGGGMGLAVCRSIVEHGGGTIELVRRRERSSRDRPGAILRIIFPLPAVGGIAEAA